MTKKIIFQDTFLIIGIMCHKPISGCGASLEKAIDRCLTEHKHQQTLPQDVEINIGAEPKATGSHYLTIKIEGQTELSDIEKQHISTTLKSSIENSGFTVLDDSQNNKDNHDNQSNYTNWINMVVNLVAISAISILSVIFPPSLLLTIGLTALSVLTTAFTARTYLINFFQNPHHMHFTSMPTTITLGWALSVAHTLYHSIRMPLASSFSMIFMSFIMPILLITILNGMDEIKRLILNESKKLHLQDMNALFPQMLKEYETHPQENQAEISELVNQRSILIEELQKPENNSDKLCKLKCKLKELQDRLLSLIKPNCLQSVAQEKNSLKKGMVIHIKRGGCFPVDCILIEEDTVVNASLVNGEPQQNKKCLDFIPAGAINLGPSVNVCAIENAFNSEVNKLLFCSNRAADNPPLKSTPTFNYLYSALVILGIAASVLVPLALGISSIPLLLQNIIGVIFAVCPCTIAIANQLPNLLSIYQRGYKGILLRNDHLIECSPDIHTIVFDKTGTLTTGNSQVESHIGITPAVWERISLLEERHGAEHPLANAITKYYKENKTEERLFNDVNNIIIDQKNRGLSGIVQGIQVHIGNAAFLADQPIPITLPPDLPEQIRGKLQQGFSPIYVAEKGKYQGVIFIKHEVRTGVLSALSQLKKSVKNIIMLTGDNLESAKIFNEQIGEIKEGINNGVFDAKNIHAGQTPEKKATFLENLMSHSPTPEGVWFVGDGLNDAPCARTVSEKKGVSCAMTSDDKAAFFTDISLNGSLDYLLQHHQLNQFLKKNIMQNQGLLIYSLVTYLAFIVTFSSVGIAVSPLIPLTIMLSTTLFTLFNSYRVPLSIDNALDKNPSWIKQLLASDLSFALPIGASFLLICGIFISTVSMGALTLPSIIFTAGTLAAISSVCILAAGTMTAFFILLTATYFFTASDEDEHSTLETGPNPISTITLAPALPTIANSNSAIVSNPDSAECNSSLILGAP